MGPPLLDPRPPGPSHRLPAHGIVEQGGPEGLEDRTIVALVAYLQRLGTDINRPEPVDGEPAQEEPVHADPVEAEPVEAQAGDEEAAGGSAGVGAVASTGTSVGVN